MAIDDLGELLKRYEFRDLSVTGQRFLWGCVAVAGLFSLFTLDMLGQDRCNGLFCWRAAPGVFPVSFLILTGFFCSWLSIMDM